MASPLFWGSAALYLANRSYLGAASDAPIFMRGHFNDLFTMPVMFPLLLFIQQALRVRSDEQHVTLAEVAFWCLLWSILFEGVFPHLTSRSVGDPIDVLCYVAGGILLSVEVILRKPVRQHA